MFTVLVVAPEEATLETLARARPSVEILRARGPEEALEKLDRNRRIDAVLLLGPGAAEAIADAVPDTIVSESTLPRLAGSMAAIPCELPRMSTDVPRTSVTSARLGSCCNACAAWVLKSGPWVNTMKSARNAPSIASLVETRTESVRTATHVTRARPIINAAAVSAVRRGLRLAFCPARMPAAPRTCATGHPSTIAIGTTSSGASNATPRNTPRKPAPMSWSFDPAEVKSPTSRAAHPSTKMTRPITIRRRGSGCVSGSASARAATGAMRVARRAGSDAAITVTMVPTSTAMMKVRGRSVTPPVDAEPNTESSARAMRIGARSSLARRRSSSCVRRTACSHSWRRSPV